MNKIKYALLAFAMFSVLAVGQKVLATVGGPAYISEIAFKAEDNSVYYKLTSHDETGCPTIIHRIDLNTLKDVEVKSCDQVLGEWRDGDGDYQQKYEQFQQDLYKGIPYLGSVSLEKNNINVDVEAMSEETIDGEILWNEFRATITQDNIKKGTIDFTGCSKDQPHLFEGYMIPGTNAMAILISSKEDCFEGGYIRETVDVIKDVTYHDTTIVRDYKKESVTEPNTANMIVYASAGNIGTNTTNTETNNPVTTASSQEKKSNLVMALFAGLILVVGAILGYIFKKRSVS